MNEGSFLRGVGMALTPRLSLDDSYVTGLRCAICSSTDLSVVHLSKFPDYVSCKACQSAFVVEAGGDWVMYGNITADLPETRAFALKQWTWLDAVAKQADDERQEQAEALSIPAPPNTEAESDEPPASPPVSEAPVQEPGPGQAADIEIPGPEPDLWDAEPPASPPVSEAPVQEPGPAPAELESATPYEELKADIYALGESAPLEEDPMDAPRPIEAELPEFSSIEPGFDAKDRTDAATAPFDLPDEPAYEGEWDALFPEAGVHVDTGPIEARLPIFDEPSPPASDEGAQGDWTDLLDEIETEAEIISESPDIPNTMGDDEEIDDTQRLLQELRAVEPVEEPLGETPSPEETPAADWLPPAIEGEEFDLSEPTPLDYEVEQRRSSLQSDWAEDEVEPPEEDGPLQEEIEARMSALQSDALDFDSILEEASEPEPASVMDGLDPEAALLAEWGGHGGAPSPEPKPASVEDDLDSEAALFAEWGGHGEEPSPEPEQEKPAIATPVEEIEPIPEGTVSEGEPETDQRFRVILLGDEITFPQDVCAHCLRRPVSKPAAVPGSLPDAESPGGRKTLRFEVPLCPDCRKRAEARSEEEKTDRLQSHLISLLIGLVLIVIVLLLGVFDPAEQLPMMIVGLLVIGIIGYAAPVFFLLSRHSKHPPPTEAARVLTTLRVQPAGTKATAFEWRNQGYAGLFRQMNRQIAEGPVTPISDSPPQAGAPKEPED